MTCRRGAALLSYWVIVAILLCPIQTGLTSLVKLLKSRPHLSQSAVEFLLGQLHLSCDSSRVLMCHSLAAIATHLPVLGDGMLGDLVDLYRVASHSSTDKQQELLVSDCAGFILFIFQLKFWFILFICYRFPWQLWFLWLASPLCQPRFSRSLRSNWKMLLTAGLCTASHGKPRAW